MNRQKTVLSLAFVIALLLFTSITALAQAVSSSASQAPTTSGASGPSSSGSRIWLQANQPLPVKHVAVGLSNGQGMTAGDSAALAGLNQSQPLSITSGDVDGDGVDDLVVGYSNGVVSVHRGNLDAFAPQSDASLKAIGRGQFPAPFHLEANTFSVGMSPDFIALGNFTGLGNKDLVVASKGSNVLYVFPGDNKGNFGQPQSMSLPGGVTSLAAGAFGNAKTILIVAVSGKKNTFSLLVYGLSANGLTSLASYPIKGAASNIVFGDFGDRGPDVAFLAGSQIQVLRSSTMKVSAVSLPVTVRAFALGSFIYDRNGVSQIALVAPDGSVQIAVRNEFDPRPYSSAEWTAIKEAAPRGRPNPLLPGKSFPGNGWKVVESFPGVGSMGAGQTPVFFRTRISNHGADDVMLLNPFSGQLALISHPDLPKGATTFLPGQVSLRPYSGTPVAALPMRINVDGRLGVIALHQGEIAPSMLEPIPDPTFFVNRFDDPTPTSPIANACNNTSFADLSSSCSLREAVLKANGDTIMLQAGTYQLSRPKVPGDFSGQNGALYVNNTVTITGAVDGSGNPASIIQAGTNNSNGVDQVMAVNSDISAFTDATASLSNLVIKFGHNNGTFAVGDGFGGGIEFDTGGAATATLTLTNCLVTDNSTTDGDGGGLALFNTNGGSGFTTITNSTIQNNSPVRATSGAAGGGIFAGTFGPAQFVLNNSKIINNNATQTSPATGSGGGIFAFGPGPSTSDAIHGGSISGNNAAGDGGGIDTTAGLVVDSETVISNNRAGTGGGGANGGNGAGVWFDASGENLNITKVTITGNSTPGGSGANPGGGGLWIGAASNLVVNMSFSRLAGNSAPNGSNLDFPVAGSPSAVTATNNWWGTNAAAATINGAATFDPFIVLTNTASPNRIGTNHSSTLTGDMSKDNHGNGAALAGNLDVLNGVPITFANAVLGTIAEAQPEALNANAQATATYNAGNVGGSGSADATVDQQTVTASITVLQPPSITKSFNPTTVTPNTASTITFSITNGNSVTINSSFTDTLAANLMVATPANVVNTCGGTVTATAGSGSISFTNANLAVGTCTIQVNVKSAVDNVYNNSVTINSTDTGTGNTSSASLTVINAPAIAKVFGAASIPLNGTTSLTFTISSSNTNLTLNGLAFADSLPAGLVVATPANLTNTCGGTATATGGSSSVSLSNASLAAGGSCTVSVSVQGTTAGTKNNNVQVTSTNGGTGNTSSASILVVSPPTISKAFGVASIPLNGITSLSFNLTNPNTATTLTGVGFSDALPGGLVISTPNGLIGSCGGGTIIALQNTNAISLSGANLAPTASCTFSVNVTGIAAGTQTNTTSNVASNEGGPGNMASASIAVVAPPVIAKAFNPTGIQPNGTSTLTLTITNPSGNSVSLTGVAFNDTFPANLVVATPGGLTNTCGGTATAPDGSGSVSLTGATLAVNSSCTVTVNVTSALVGTYPNTTDPVTSSNGGDGNQASATLSVALAPTISKIFVPDTVQVNFPTQLSFTINNPNSDPNTNVTLTGISFTDALPTGLLIASPNQLNNNCGGTVTANPGTSTITLTGGTVGPAVGLASIPLGPGFGPSLGGASTGTTSSNTTSTGGSKTIILAGPSGADGASGSCFVSVAVVPSVVGTLMNTSGVISANESGPGATSNTANLTVTGAPVVTAPTLAKAFGTSDIAVGQSTSLTFTVTNPNSSTTLFNTSFTDVMPSGLVVATPNGLSGDCISNEGAGVTAIPGTATIVFAASMPPVTTCSFSVNITATSGGVKNNTTSTISGSFDAGGGNFETVFGGSASASITVEAPVLAIMKGHSADFHRRDIGDTYTITVSNIGAGHTLGTVTVTDILPNVNNTLVPTNLGGVGWTCTLNTLTCTRSDALNGGNSYPAIILTVNVPQNIQANVTNAATVSGGGDQNSHTAFDPTHIGPPR